MNQPMIGILGGMGPLASSGFVNFLYQKCQRKIFKEQDYPRIILFSDPTIPDRMECVDHQQDKKIVGIFENKIQELLNLGATHVLICCFTAHYFLNHLSSKNRQFILHLGDILTDYVNQQKKPMLILGSELFVNSRLIESQYAIYPRKKDLLEVNRLIYAVKLNGPKTIKNELVSFSKYLCGAYSVPRILFACTEFHLIYQLLYAGNMENYPIQFLDGLNVVSEFIIKKLAKLP